MEAKAVDIKKRKKAVNEFGSVEAIINLPQTSFVSHDIKWIEFRTQIASAHAQRVWIKFDQIAHALLCLIWEDEEKMSNLLFLKRVVVSVA